MFTYPLSGSGIFGGVAQFKLETFNISNTIGGFYHMPFTNIQSTSTVTVDTTNNGSGAQIFELSNTGTYKLTVYDGTATIDTGTQERTVSWWFQKYASDSENILTEIYKDGPSLIDSAGPTSLNNFNINFYHSDTANQFVFGVGHGGATTASFNTAGWYLQLEYIASVDIT